MSDEISTPEYRTTVGRNALWSMLNQSVGQILALAVFFVTARFVSKEDFGVMAIALLAIEFFRQITIESVGISLTARKDTNDADYNAGFILITAGSIISAIVMYAIAPFVASLLSNPAIEHALQISSVVVVAMGLSRTHETWMIKNMQFKLLALRSIVAVSVGGAVGIYMAVNGYGLLSLIVQQIIVSMLGMALLWLASSWRPKFETTKACIGDIFSYSKHVAMNSLAFVISGQGDTFFASYYLGSAATGVYNASKRLLLATQLMIFSGLNNVALSVFSTHGDLQRAYFKAAAYTALITAPFYMGLAVLSQDFVLIILGDKWMEAAPVMSVLAVTMFLTSMDQYNTNVMLVSGKPQWQTALTSLHAALNIVLMIVFARYGLHYVALAMVAKSLIVFPVSLFLALRLLQTGIVEYFKTIHAPLLATVVMGGFIYTLDNLIAGPNPFLNLLVVVPAGILVYIAALYLIDRRFFQESAGLFNAMLKIGKRSEG